MYCIDTSALIEAWVGRYPPENFPKLWAHLDHLISNGRITAPAEVLTEIEKKSDELHPWLKQREKALVTPYDDAFLANVKALLRRFPRLVMEKKQRFAADPFVITLAQRKRWKVVTEEKPTGSLNRPNIPDVCNELSIDGIPLIRLIRDENWVIS
jgi:Domain of unknown function (DUF4411)